MFLTQEDYRKIESWLKQNSKRDTDFDYVDSMDGTETVAIVQNNLNKSVLVTDLLTQVRDLYIRDFINVSADYGMYKISLEEAILLIPEVSRRTGTAVSFQNPEGAWGIYQFTGSLGQWYDLDLWKDILDWRTHVVNSVIPDEEDITASLPDSQGNSFIKLADKVYSPADHSGLGHKILRKNLTEDAEGTVINLLTLEDFDSSNTIYEIKYAFDLNGLTISLPTGCALFFNGGSVSNGKINGNGGEISTVSNYGILNDTIISDFNIPHLDIRWFGAEEGGIIDEAMTRAVACYRNFLITPIYIKGHYRLTLSITCRGGIQLKGDADEFVTHSKWASSTKNGETRYTAYEDDYYIAKNNTLNIPSVIDVAAGITAFVLSMGSNKTTNLDAFGDLTYNALETVCKIEGIRFICTDEAGSVEQCSKHYNGTLNPYTSTAISIQGGLLPTNGYSIKNCSFTGFNRAIDFKGPISAKVGDYGSIAYDVLIERCYFRFNDYSVYAYMENQLLGQMTAGGIHITHCKFNRGCKLWLDGIYGNNRIENSSFEFNHDCLYTSIRYGCLDINNIYLENTYGDWIIEQLDNSSATGLTNAVDMLATVSVGELFYFDPYSTETSDENKFVTFNFKNVTISKLPSQARLNRFLFSGCAFNEGTLATSIEGPLKFSNFVMSEGTLNSENRIACLVYKTAKFDVISNYAKPKHGNSTMTPSYIMKGFYRCSPTTRMLGADTIWVDTLSLSGTKELNWKSPTGLSLNGLSTNVITFYKGYGPFKVEFISVAEDGTETIRESVITPRSAGLCMILTSPLKYLSEVSKVRLSVKGKPTLIGNRYFSSLHVQEIQVPSGYSYMDAGIISDWMKLTPTYEPAPFGTTSDRPKATIPTGFRYFDTILGKPIFWNGNNAWVDSTGATV